MNTAKFSAFSAMVVLSACASEVPPTTQILSPLSISEPPILLVSANRDRDRVISSLAHSGLTVTNDLREANLVLEAKLGSSRSRSACGKIRNVSYVLRGGGAIVMQIKGRGGTGTCPNSILDLMSLELAQHLNTWTASP